MRIFALWLIKGLGFGLGFIFIAFLGQWMLPWDKTETHYVYEDAHIKLLSYEKANGGMNFAIGGEFENISTYNWHGVALEASLYENNRLVDKCIGTTYGVKARELVPFHIRCENTTHDKSVIVKDVRVKWLSYRPYEKLFQKNL